MAGQGAMRLHEHEPGVDARFGGSLRHGSASVRNRQTVAPASDDSYHAK
jgi:hypothetical protein